MLLVAPNLVPSGDTSDSSGAEFAMSKPVELKRSNAVSQLDINTLLQVTSAPEVRLPNRHSARMINRTFYVVVGCVMAIGITPFLIGWAAAVILK
jgi:hypothetical protein